jgi:hypothetical protein
LSELDGKRKRGGQSGFYGRRSRRRREDADVESGSRIGERVTARILRETRRRVPAMQHVIAGRAMAEEFQTTVVSPSKLARLHPAHAVYVWAQNHTSVMSEQLTAFGEMAPFVKMLSRAEDLYMPGGPPMSPLTKSFYTCWAFFDACVETTGETIGAVILETGARFGMNADLLRAIRLMQESRMGIYAVDAMESGSAILREVVTGTVRRVIVPSGNERKQNDEKVLHSLVYRSGQRTQPLQSGKYRRPSQFHELPTLASLAHQSLTSSGRR